MSNEPDTDLFNTLEKTPAGRGSLTAIVSGTEKCLLILLPWHKARCLSQNVNLVPLSHLYFSSDNPHLEQIIKRIVNNCIRYIQAIEMSLKIAGDGYSLASDAVDVCEFVVDPTTDPEDLREYIDDMKGKAKEAHQDCKEVSEKFRAVQAGIFEVCCCNYPLGISDSVYQMSKALPKEVMESQEGDKSRFIRFYSAVSKAANKILPSKYFGRLSSNSIYETMKNRQRTSKKQWLS